MTDVMEDIDYKLKNFNRNEAEHRHPLWVSSGHFIYHLTKSNIGHLCCVKDVNSLPVCSPRKLIQMCIYKLICNPRRMRKIPFHHIPASIYPTMLTEAIFLRELQSIDLLVSTWPLTVLDVQSILPLEDNILPAYMTVPVEGHESMSLLDCFMIGLLNTSDNSRLRVVNFTGFKNDRKLCRELSRLPILWMRPMHRKAQKILDVLSRYIDIKEEKVQKYLNRMKCIYSNMDVYVKHGNKFGPITIIWDCKVTLDDVPIGLGLQYETPFRFACQRIWMESISDVDLPPNKLNKVLEARHITHLELEDPEICMDINRFDLLLEGLLLLPGLVTLSLPNTIHIEEYPNAPYELNQALQSLHSLKKLSFASCNLRSNLDILLGNLHQPFQYLNLRDCRLSKVDIQFLLQWQPLMALRELNLGRNNVKTLAYLLVALLHRMPDIACFSLSYSCLTTVGLKQVVRQCSGCEQLKILCVQSFVPPPLQEIEEMLRDCANIKTLQKFVIFPEAYAFPGRDEVSREQNRKRICHMCIDCLKALKRPDISLG